MLWQVLVDDNPSISSKCAAYDLLRCIADDGDGAVCTRLAENASRDLKLTGMPDLVIAALGALQTQPKHIIVSFWLASDADKTACALLGPEAAPAVRERAALVLLSSAFQAWLLSDGFVVTSSPQSSFPEQHRKRQLVQDRVSADAAVLLSVLCVF